MGVRLNGQTSGYVELDAPATAGNNTLKFPNGNGSSGQVMTTDGSGNLSFAAPQLSADTTPQLGGDLDMNSNFISSGILGVKNTGAQSEVRLYCEVSNAHYAAIKAPAHSNFSGNITFTMPATAGSANQVLKTDGSGVTDWTSAFSPTSITIDGPYKQVAEAVGALDIDLSTGNYFTKTINGNSTFTFSNPPASGTVGSFVLELTHTSGTVTWPSSVKFPADTAPTLTTGKTHLFFFVTDDGGTRYRGASLVDYVN